MQRRSTAGPWEAGPSPAESSWGQPRHPNSHGIIHCNACVVAAPDITPIRPPVIRVTFNPLQKPTPQKKCLGPDVKSSDQGKALITTGYNLNSGSTSASTTIFHQCRGTLFRGTRPAHNTRLPCPSRTA